MKHVILKLKDGSDIIGKSTMVEDSGIFVDDALVLNYGYSDHHGGSVIYMTKYSKFTTKYGVHFPNSQITFISNDIIPSLITFYEIALKRVKKSWVSSMEEEFKMAAEYATSEKEKQSPEETFSDILNLYGKTNNKIH